jgi:hypothetical protein
VSKKKLENERQINEALRREVDGYKQAITELE